MPASKISDPIIATDDGMRIEASEARIGEGFTVTAKQLRPSRTDRLTDSQKRTLVGAINFYGKRNHYRLSETIRQSVPWQQARATGGAAIEPAAFRFYREFVRCC